MPLDSSSTLGGVGGGVLPESVPARRADTTGRPSTPASSLSQKAAENTMGAYHNLERCQRWAVDPVDRGVHGGKRASVFPRQAPRFAGGFLPANCPQGPQPVPDWQRTTAEHTIQATGAAMEVTKWLKPSGKRATIWWQCGCAGRNASGAPGDRQGVG